MATVMDVQDATLNSRASGRESQFIKLLLECSRNLAQAHFDELKRARAAAPDMDKITGQSPPVLCQGTDSVASEPHPGAVGDTVDDFEYPEDSDKSSNSQVADPHEVFLHEPNDLRDIAAPQLGQNNSLAKGSHSSSASGMSQATFDVTLLEASGLRDADGIPCMGSSDPYVVCEVRGKPDTRFQTKVVQNNVRPVWNHQQVLTGFHESDILDFFVYDCDYNVKGDDLLGSAQLIWNDVCEDGFFGPLHLTSGSGPHEETAGVLLVQVTPKSAIVDPAEEDARLEELITAAQVRWPQEQLDYDHHPHHECAVNSASLHLSQQLDQFALRSAHGAVLTGSGFARYFVIDPLGYNSICWNLLGIICVFMDIAFVPLILAFDVDHNSDLQFIMLLVAGYWTLNIPRSFVSGVVQAGIVEMRIPVLSAKYLKTWFFPDVILASLDWAGILANGLLVDGRKGRAISKLVRIFRLARFTRSLGLIRMFKVYGSFKKCVDIIESAVLNCLLNVTILVAVMLIFCHYLGCIWYAIGVRGGSHGWVELLNQEFRGDHDLAYEYMSSVHWALTQFMPASAGIKAGTLSERSYVFAVDVFGFVCFSFFVSNVQMQLNGLKNHNVDRHRRMNEMRKFFNDKKVPLSLASSVTDFVRNQERVKVHKSLKDIQAFNGLPSELARKLNTAIYRPTISQHPFMSGVSHWDKRTFARICHEVLVERSILQGFKLFEHQALATSMYFITEGFFLYCRTAAAHELTSNAWVAEASLWIQGWIHRGCLTAHRESVALEIPATEFLNVLFVGGERLRTFAKVYAAKFVRSGDDEDESLRFSDMWSHSNTLLDFASVADRTAGLTSKQFEHTG